MTDSMERVVERVQKLLALGRRGGTEAEAAAAMAKAQELLTAHNLDMAAVEGAQVGSAAREKAAQAGGMYVYQRELWRGVAELNFCLYFRRHARDERDLNRPFQKRPWRSRHMIVGRKVNTAATLAMGGYLEQVINRLCRERLEVRSGGGVTPGELNSQFFSSWAVGFREGVADRVLEKVAARRRQVLRDEARRQRRAEATTSTATTVTLLRYASAEEDANIDFLHGEGTAAEWAATRAEAAAEARRAAEEYTRWAAAHPEEAAERERKEEARLRRAGGGPTREVNGGGWRAGYEAGERVGIDPQATAATARRLAR